MSQMQWWSEKGCEQEWLEDMKARFLERVEKTPTCWNWTGYLNPNGYGDLKVKDLRGAHRVSYALFVGKIPNGLIVMHSCDNKKCVNPAHLSVGTHSQNVSDGYARGLAKPRDISGDKHPQAKINWDVVGTMRQLYADGMGPKAIADKFGLKRSLVVDVLNRRNWNKDQPGRHRTSEIKRRLICAQAR